MFNLLSALRKQRLWDFPGGIHPPEMKSQSSIVPLRSVPLPDRLIIPLKQHLGPEGELRVAPGDDVLRGQPLTAGSGRTLPVHAPTSGTIAAIAPHRTAHPSGLGELSVILLPDGEDRWITRQPLADFLHCSPAQLLCRIHDSGIAGLGGAGFPTAAKLGDGKHGVETLIINGAECEPYITADDRLMQEHARDIVTGMAILQHMLQPQRLLLGIEDNKPAAIAALKGALCERPIGELRVVPTKYPSGGAKQLTKILTGKEVPAGQHSAAIGVVMLNVGTVYAITRAVINGEALTERVVTLTGEALARPGNVWARIGTPVSHLLAHAGFTPDAEPTVIMGGPLMGFTLPALEVPVVKTSNCLLAPSVKELAPAEPEQSCIRCSRCADACPASLLPQQLYWFSRGQEHDKARQHHLFDCIECGACAYVCPSNIPLVHYYRQQKAEIRALDDDARRAAMAKARFEAKLARREREKQQRLARHQQAAVTLDDAAAIARVKARRQAVPDGPDASAQIAPAAPADPSADVAGDSTDPRKAAVAAAIARVKARRQAVQDGPDASALIAPAAPAAGTADVAGDSMDPRKASVAAAIARVKARRQAAQGAAGHPSQPPPAPPNVGAQEASDNVTKTATGLTAPDGPLTPPADNLSAGATRTPAALDPFAPGNRDVNTIDPRKAAVVAAIARVKARRQAAQESTVLPNRVDAAPDCAENSTLSDNVTTSMTATSGPAGNAAGAMPPPPQGASAAATARQKAEKNLPAATTISSEED